MGSGRRSSVFSVRYFTRRNSLDAGICEKCHWLCGKFPGRCSMLAAYIIGGIVVVLAVIFVVLYNGLVRLRNQVKNAYNLLSGRNC